MCIYIYTYIYIYIYYESIDSMYAYMPGARGVARHYKAQEQHTIEANHNNKYAHRDV